ncbi:MAG: pyridoxal phosphate-dependent aminotransferase [Candidatus Methylopumilus sp.]
MSDIKLSDCVGRIKESPTLAITAKAARYKSEGKDIIGLATGEPDFDTPQHIKDAAKKAIDNGFTKYTPVSGIPSLKKAIIEKFKRDNNLEYNANEIIVSVGGKQCIFNFCLAVLNAGDEVIIPAPYWVSYADIALVSNAKPVIVECGIEQKFKMTAKQLEKAITPKTKLLMLNSPSNPTGAVYSKEELDSLAKILTKHPNILIGTDDMYEHVKLMDIPFYNILNVEPSLKDRCVVMNGVSKAYSMTGWRIGFAAGPCDIIKAMEILQSQSTSNPTSISQVAAEAALSGEQACMQPMIKAFRERHDYVVKSFNEIPGLSCIEAEGAFYAFPDARKAIERLYDQKILKEKTDLALADYLLEKEGVAIVPGSAFGSDGYFRISFATSMDNLVEAMKRIKRALTV